MVKMVKMMTNKEQIEFCPKCKIKMKFICEKEIPRDGRIKPLFECINSECNRFQGKFFIFSE